MKKMSFTNYESASWLFHQGRLTFLILFTLCLAGFQSLEAQVVHPVGVSGKASLLQHKIETCEGASVQYTDDDSVDKSLYADDDVDGSGNATTVGRMDTVEFCPQDRWHLINVTFTDFDIAGDDVLRVYDGSYDSLQSDGAAAVFTDLSGTGVSAANGGWVAASCSPDDNQTGCLTFVFNTTGTNTKGKGWDAWVSCADRNIRLDRVNIQNAKLECTDITADVTIPAPRIRTDCGTILPALTLIVKNQAGVACQTPVTVPAGTAATDVVLTGLGAGSYIAEWYLTNDPKKTTGSLVFSVSLPALVCNDNVNIPLGSGCSVEIDPDDVLENPCTPLPGHITYNVTVKFGSGKLQVTTGSGSGAAAGGIAEWPIITKELLDDAGVDVCGGTAEVTIERVYTPTGATCDNGDIKDKCTTTISFSDDTNPIVQLSVKDNADTLIACDAASLEALLSAKAIDNCSDATTSISIRMEETDPCFNSGGMFGKDTTRAFVTVTATDGCGNTGRLDKTFIILRPHDFVIPPTGKFECSESDKDSGIPGLKVGYIKPGGDRVITDTLYKLSEKDYYCGYILKSERTPIPATDCGEKEFVNWYYLDWCAPEAGLQAIGQQFVEYTDTEAPLFTDTLAARRGINIDNSRRVDNDEYFKVTDTIRLDLGHFECMYDVSKITKPRATDNCDANPTVSLFRIYNYEEDGTYWNLRTPATIECGTYYLVWAVDDKCHEQTGRDFLYQPVVIEDNTKPSAVCTDQLNVSLPNAWGARVSVEDVDAGSYDACGIKFKGIRIKGTDHPYTETIDIGCEYLHPDLQIEMQVIDNKGNENTCWLDVVVEDKIDPICNPLEDKTVNCDEIHDGELGASTDADGDRTFEDSEWTALEGDLMATYNARFGAPNCEDNLKTTEGCASLTIEQQYQLIEWPCGEIEIRRRYRAFDWSGNDSEWAGQNIKVIYKANWSISLPQDASGTCTTAPAEFGITINNGACDLLGYEHDDKRYEVPGDACYKIERTYHIINWCKYKAGEEPTVLARVEGEHGFADGYTITSDGDNADKGYFTYIQIIKVHDDEAPVVTVTDPEPCINGVEFDALPYGEEDQTPGSAPYECDEVKTWSATATDCSDQSAITWVGRLFDASGDMVKEVNSNTLSYVVSNKETYTAEFWAYDGCGNSAGERGETLTFWDCKKPTPYVLNGVAVEIMQANGDRAPMVSVWVSDVNQNSFDNCTDQAFLDMRMWHQSLGEAPTTLEGVQALPKVIDFTCEYLGTQVVNVYVIDEEENYDYAATYVIIQDNMGACGTVEPGNPDGMVAGAIVNANGENVQSVSIAVNGAEEKSMTTSEDGHYMFMLEKGGDYTVTPQKDMNPLNGVSTFDLVLISKHILGISTFDTPYKYIAADVNKSGSITAFDMVQLRQLILNITSEFPNNASWRFVESGYEFTSANPAAESFSEFMSINNLNADMENMDFVAVKVGDVNGNALANNLLGAETRNTNGTLNFNVADRFVEAGQTVTVDFAAANIASAQGYQFTMNFAGLELNEVVEGVAKTANFNTTMAQRGVLTTSWNGEATANDELFSLTFTANTAGLLSELISVSSDFTAAEAYNTAGELMNVNINFNSTATAAGFELNQNTPNPFKAETVIGFNLPEAGTATLKVLDVQGKVLKAIKADYAKGYNQVSLNANELGATGVLYYQLESADNVATKKMIIIE